MKQIIFITLFALIFASCTKDEAPAPDGGKTGNPNAINFDISIGNNLTTKAYTDADFKTYFVTGDTIGVFAAQRHEIDTGSYLHATGNYAHNKAYIRQANGTWAPATATDSLFYPINEELVLDFYAYYPYNNNANINPLAADFAVNTAQANTANYNASDLMSGTNTTGFSKAQGATPISITFSHHLALVQVEIYNDGTGSEPNHTLAVNLTGFKPAAVFNLETQRASVNSSAPVEPISMCRVQKEGTPEFTSKYTYRALVPAQTLANGALTYTYTLNNTWYNYTLNAQTEYKAAQAKQYKSVTPFSIPMVSIPLSLNADGYSFLMGSPNGSGGINGSVAEQGRDTSEMLHKVKLTQNYRMSKYEVTNAQWCAFLNIYNAQNPGSEITDTETQYRYNNNNQDSDTTWFSLSGQIQIEYIGDKWQAKTGMGNHPFINVSHSGAMAFCTVLGYRLPTEAEWEYACRAGSQTAYSFGNDATDLIDYAWNDSPHDVGTKLPNAFGLYDMHGNVYEWCADKYATDYGIAGINYTNIYTNPKGANSGHKFVVRSSDWDPSVSVHRSARRNVFIGDERMGYVGFRVVL